MSNNQWIRKIVCVAVMSIVAFPAWADWHAGLVTTLSVGYDGSTIAFRIAGWSRTDCTCYAVWNVDMCLDRTRLTFREEYTMLLKARAAGTPISVNINETTCTVIAMVESD
jgi:hypothetical protein